MRNRNAAVKRNRAMGMNAIGDRQPTHPEKMARTTAVIPSQR
jgi:hypothetical protein